MSEASRDVNASFDAQAGSFQRRLRATGATLDADQQATQQRNTGLSRALADVSAQNLAAYDAATPAVDSRQPCSDGRYVMARGVGATLQSLGQGVQQDAMSTLGAAAEQETVATHAEPAARAATESRASATGTTLGARGFAAGTMLTSRRRCACRVCQWACGHGGWRVDWRHRWRNRRRSFRLRNDDGPCRTWTRRRAGRGCLPAMGWRATPTKTNRPRSGKPSRMPTVRAPTSAPTKPLQARERALGTHALNRAASTATAGRGPSGSSD